jgi:hypothetical protein
MKKLERLMQQRGLTIDHNDTAVHGRFTVVTLVDDHGHQATGLSRRSDEDKPNNGRGIEIARGRAEHALYNILKNRKIQSPLMG